MRNSGGLSRSVNPALELQRLTQERLKQPVATPIPTEPILDDSSQASNIASNIAISQASNIASYVASIDDLKNTPLSQLNIRVPQGFNDWLDEHAHRHRKEGVTKQSLVALALQMLIGKIESDRSGSGRPSAPGGTSPDQALHAASEATAEQTGD